MDTLVVNRKWYDIIEKMDNLFDCLVCFGGTPLYRDQLIYHTTIYAVNQLLVEVGKYPAHQLYDRYWTSILNDKEALQYNDYTFDQIKQMFGDILLLNVLENNIM